MQDDILAKLNKAIEEGIQADLDAQNAMLKPLPQVKLERVNPVIHREKDGYLVADPLLDQVTFGLGVYKPTRAAVEIAISHADAVTLSQLSDEALKQQFRVIAHKMLETLYTQYPKFESLAQLGGESMGTFKQDALGTLLSRAPYTASYILRLSANFCVL